MRLLTALLVLSATGHVRGGFCQEELAGKTRQAATPQARAIAIAPDGGLVADAYQGGRVALSRIGHVIDASGVINLGEAAALCSGLIDARGVELTIAEGLPAVVADRTRMIEVFQNLIENAVKFRGDQPAPRIDTETRDGETVCFVRDNGGGIDPESLARVFGMFERLEERGEGTGIGLALVERITEVHGGRIWAESEGRGKGTTFLFTVSW